MKKMAIISMAVVLALAFTVPCMAASTTDTLLQRAYGAYGGGKLTWDNATPVTVTYAAAYATTATLAVSTDEVFTIASDYGAAEVILTASSTGAHVATVEWASDVFTIDSVSSGYTTQETADCSGGTVTIGACDALIQALNCVVSAASEGIHVVWSAPYNSVGYSNYGNAAMVADEAAAVVDSATPLEISTTAKAAHDSALLDCTGMSVAACEAEFESMFEGDVHTWVSADGLDTDLANGFNDVANLGAASYTAADDGLEILFTAGGAVLDQWEEDRFVSISHITASCNFTTACSVRVLDGDTLIWESAALVDDTRTVFDFTVPFTATSGNVLKAQIYSADTIADTSYIMVVGQTK